MFSIDLLRDAVVLGLLLGCFYAAVSVGLSISFGLLDVPQVAHPAFLVLASYGVYLLNDSYDIDPLVAGLIITPLFFLLGFVAYRLYYETLREARQRRRGARHRLLLRHRLHHRSADHHAIWGRSALGHRALYRQGLAHRRHADSDTASLSPSRSRWH